ncbi:MAG: DUF190 domain-containing protein [Proteobacteria bacterium]|nr:DUF190 domain-containing protein [Pseudomonadota bacterium]
MKAPTEAVLLRIYSDEEALVGDRSLIDTVVERARSARLAGATVLRGRTGFGQASRLHGPKPFSLRDNLPVVLEIVDELPALEAFVSSLDDLHDIGLITFEKVQVVRYGSPGAGGHV